jgi:hypothetical protein
MMTRVISALCLLLLTGCATTQLPEAPKDHPANAAAKGAPPAAPSAVLAVNALDPIEKADIGTQSEGQTEHGKSAHAEDAQGHAHDLKAAPSEQLYTCPMHPSVTSKDPNDRCPKCKMKINKPVKGTADEKAPTSADNHPHHEGHGGHEK